MLSTTSVSSSASEGVVSSRVVDDAQQVAPPSNKVEVGSIFVSAWGVGQTNIDFYQVVGVTAKTVVMQAVQADVPERCDSGYERSQSLQSGIEPLPFVPSFGPSDNAVPKVHQRTIHSLLVGCSYAS